MIPSLTLKYINLHFPFRFEKQQKIYLSTDTTAERKYILTRNQFREN